MEHKSHHVFLVSTWIYNSDKFDLNCNIRCDFQRAGCSEYDEIDLLNCVNCVPFVYPDHSLDTHVFLYMIYSLNIVNFSR